VLEEFLEEMVPHRHARSAPLGEQTPIPPGHQGSMDRATYDCVIGRLGHAHLGLRAAGLKAYHCIEDFHHR
jgi:hypothetical protein